MDKAEAKTILQDQLVRLKSKAYRELCELLTQTVTYEIKVASGAVYQVEVEGVWDDEESGHLRIMVAIDDGGWRALAPLTDSFIIATDGTFVGE